MTTTTDHSFESRDVMSSKTRTRTTRTSTKGAAARMLRSVPDQPSTATVLTTAEDKLWATLHANPNSTATELATAATIGKSTAQKILVKWAGDGSVTRTSGIAKGGRRAADVWAITEIDATDDSTVRAADTEETANAGPTAAPAPDDVRDATETADDVVRSTSHDAEGSSAERLPSGALRGMVEDWLRDHFGEQAGPTKIAKDLGGKSSGAVSNALDKLVKDGVAVKTQDKPRRFALAPAQQTTAAPTAN
jgi:hypothetical protein